MVQDGDSDIIDLGEYRRKRPEARRSAFAVWGGEGERSRFALPVWRAVYLVGGERGALVWVDDDDGPGKQLHPFFVLDLASETPRTTFPPELLGELRGNEGVGPILSETFPGGAAVFLGVGEKRRWFLVVHDGGLPRQPMDGTARNDLLFLAGECAGLLLHRRLDEHPQETEEDGSPDWRTPEGWEEEELSGWGDLTADEVLEAAPDWPPAPGEYVHEGEDTPRADDPDEDPDPPPGSGRGHLRSL